MSTIFRDPSEGAAARRQDLLRRRRDELVMMPHAIRRVFVARRARTAASIVVALIGAALLVATASPSLARFLAKGLPGINPAVLCTLLVAMWISALFAYAFARALDEHRFAVAMSHFVMPSSDVDQDIERLSHERPDFAARDMAHQLESRSAALPVLAASVLLPVTALFVVAAVRAKGWPAIADFESNIAAHAKFLIGSAIAGVVLAIVMTRKFARLPSAAPVAAVVMLFDGALAIGGWHWLVTGALLAGTVAVVVRRLRKERVLLEAEDPAAGSEVFTLRGFVRQVRTVVGRYATRRNLWIAAGGSLLMVAMLSSSEMPKTRAAAVQQAVPAPMPVVAPAPQPSGSNFRIEKSGNGELRIHIDATVGQEIVIPSLGGMSVVPAGWNARVIVSMEEHSVGAVRVTMDGSTQAVERYDREASSAAVFSLSACGDKIQTLDMHIEGPVGGSAVTRSYTLIVKPILELAGC